jgi:chromosome partitioning protein
MKHARFRILLTKVRPPPQTVGEQLRASLKEMAIPVFKAQILLLVAYRMTSADGVSMRDVKDRHARRAWLAYEKVGREIVNGR